MQSLFCGPEYTAQVGNSTTEQQWNSSAWPSGSGLYGQLVALECLVDGLNFIPHVVVLPVAVLLVAVVGRYRHHDYTRLQNRAWVLFPGHSVRWVTISVLLFVSLCEIGEGVLSDSYTPGHHPHLYVPWITAFMATILAGVFYNVVEKLNSPRLLLILGLYHLLSGGCKLLRLSHLYSRGVSTDSLRFQLTWASVLLYVLLIAVETYVLYRKRYLTSASVEDPAPEDLLQEDMRFVLPYASLPSAFTVLWLDWLLMLGYKQPLEFEHLGQLPKETQAEANLERLRKTYRREKEKAEGSGKPLSLWRVYIRAFILSRDYVISASFMLLTQIVMLMMPLILREILIWVTMETAKQTEETSVLQGQYMVSLSEILQNGFFLLLLLLLLNIMRVLAQAQSMLLSFKVGVEMEKALQAMIYSKCLRLPSWLLENENVTMGQITNHMSTGCDMLRLFIFLFHFSWAALFQLIAATILLYYQLGWNAVLAVSFLVLLLPLDLFLMWKMHAINTLKMEKTDVRLKWINESIQGIKLLKLNAWEQLFVGKVTEARKGEVTTLYSHTRWRILALFINTAGPLITTLIAFGSYEYFNDKPLTAADAFTALSLFYTLNGPFEELPQLLGLFTAASVSTKRIGPFLQSLEVERMGDEPRFGAECEQMNGGTQAVGDLNKAADVKATSTAQRERSADNGGLKFTNSRTRENQDLPDDVSIEVRDGSFAWEVESQTANISDINLQIPKGMLTIVVGQVGSGKSSLLSAILGEMRTLKGQVLWNKKHRTVSYASQRPWLLNASLRDNVTFGLPFENRRYQQVISACCLQPDIDILPAGDLTEIGEKGINLSGGQKQRVSVARAMYAQTDVVLLDDPLSALDAHVGSHLFEQGIMGQLVRDHRTVVLVTHKLQYLEHAHLIVAMEKGQIIATGTMAEIQESSPDLHRSWMDAIMESVRQIDEGLVLETGPIAQKEHRRSDYRQQEDGGSTVAAGYLLQNRLSQHLSTTSLHKRLSQHLSTTSLHNRLSQHLSTSSLASDVDDVWVRRKDWREDTVTDNQQKTLDNGDVLHEDREKHLGELGKLVEKEERIEGDVELKYYFIFAAACGVHLAVLVFLLQVSRAGVALAMDFWLAAWSGSAGANMGVQNITGVNSTLGNVSQPISVPDTTGYYIRGYTGISLTAIVLTAAAVTASVLSMLRGARVMHDRMVHNIVRAPMRFFDTTPTGRILNRMSGDQTALDDHLPGQMEGLIRVSLLVISALIAIAVVSPYFLIGVIPVLVGFYFMQRLFRSSARELKRIESIKKSPVFSQLSESFGGLSTIRAYRAERRFTEEMMKRLNEALVPQIYMMCVQCWVAVRMLSMGALVIFVAGLSSAVVAIQGLVSPGWVGLAISYAIRIQIDLFACINEFAFVEVSMTSLERIDTYSRVPGEPYQDKKTGNAVPPSEWPASGQVQLEGVSARYDQTLDPVLLTVTATIGTGEKVGVCGRTGSGKSSLTLALFRMIDVFEGKVYIDGVDISCVPLTLLRSRLSIIPQDPVLFSGTIRFNLDPEGGSDDEELWRALEIAQIKTLVADMPNKLDEMVTEGGDNFSVGQRQLFCLARAFVRRSRILIMDEATASVDMETDAVLQEVIKTAFRDRTVITVAHRIATILNSDRILVLDQGKVVENDSPDNLLKKPDGLFTAMVKANK